LLCLKEESWLMRNAKRFFETDTHVFRRFRSIWFVVNPEYSNVRRSETYPMLLPPSVILPLQTTNKTSRFLDWCQLVPWPWSGSSAFLFPDTHNFLRFFVSLFGYTIHNASNLGLFQLRLRWDCHTSYERHQEET
jgi:hypothetical protein